MARWNGPLSWHALSLFGFPSVVWQKNLTFEGSPFGKYTTLSSLKSSAQTSPLGVTMTPCITPSFPPKLKPSSGDSGLPLLSSSDIVRPPVLFIHTRSCASMAVPNPGPMMPPPPNPLGDGDSGVPLGANFADVPLQNESALCMQTMKSGPVQ